MSRVSNHRLPSRVKDRLPEPMGRLEEREMSRPGCSGVLRTDHQVRILGFLPERIQEQAEGKRNQVHLEGYTLCRQRMRTISGSGSGPRAWGLRLSWAKSFHKRMTRRNIPAISGKGGDFSEIGSLPTFWPFTAHLGTVMASGGVIFRQWAHCFIVCL